MSHHPVFEGAATALITPMTAAGVDYEALERLIEAQITGGIDALVVTGTTGENATLTDPEHQNVIRFCVEKVRHRVPVIAGTGSNYTDHAIEMTRFACEAGADAVLLVCPYYNKATQRGAVASFRAIADASTVPCILYNVPSRTGFNLSAESVYELSKHPMIAGIKEASGDISKVAQIRRLCGPDFPIYSGNDDQIIPILSLGGKGVISVLSNVLPGETSRLVHDYLEGRTAQALEAQLRYLPLVDALFSEVNPIPVKAAVSAMGYGENYLRLPLCPMDKALEENLLRQMQALGIRLEER